MKIIIRIIRAMYRYYLGVGKGWRLFEYILTAAFVLLLGIIGRKKISRSKRIIADLFFFYVITVLTSTVLARRSGTTASYNLDLFWSFRDILAGRGDSWLTTIENITLFVPFGLLVPELVPKRGRMPATMLLGFSFSLLIEGLQLVLKRGMFELDDIVTNTIGVIVGILLYLGGKWIVRKIAPDKRQ